MTVDELKAEALRLAPHARADLARDLLSSLDQLSEAEIRDLWLDEAARRDRELDAGTVTAIPAEEVLARVKARRA
jgi:putative addiction module component (TIGR02574 family)